MVLVVLTFGAVFGCVYSLSTAFLEHKSSNGITHNRRVSSRLSESSPLSTRTYRF